MAHVLVHWYRQVPLVTRCYLAATLLTTTACYLEGIVAGHAYYFLEDIYPRMTGRRPLKTPAFIKAWFADDEVMVRPTTNVRHAPPAPQDELIRDE